MGHTLRRHGCRKVVCHVDKTRDSMSRRGQWAGRQGIKFANLVDAGCPVDCAVHYRDTGADELVMLDVSATPNGRATAAETVASIRAVLDVPLTVGGGVRSIQDAERLLNAGADKVAINSAAVGDPTLINALASAFGSQCTVVAVDAASTGNTGWRFEPCPANIEPESTPSNGFARLRIAGPERFF